ncbi:MAG: dienelactone hydrolase family protein [Clostridiales bacterium]|jgi:pimeloyl-ACP methyl ester carboxylesterase|nr:dienelactone hydrolase family protein [Clostridiales bacterium]
MKVDFSNKIVGGFNYELIRGLSTQHADAAEFGECMETMDRIKDNDFESWTAEWTKTADYTADYARSQLKNGDRISAGKAFTRASNYYRMSVFYTVHTDPRHRNLWEKSKETFYGMIDLMEYPIERVDIPFEDAVLPGYFVSSGMESRPTLIALGGFDSTMEEVYCWIGSAARNYGWNCLIFEGPGQWGALMNNPGLTFRPDYEKPVAAAVDYLISRNDIDKEKIAIIGYSMGGYLCVRGAIDPRVKACIPNTLVVDCGASAKAGMKGLLKNDAFMDKSFNLMMKINGPARWSFHHSSWTLGINSAHEWVAAYEKFTLLGYEELLKGKSMLFMFSEDDIVDAAAPSPEIVTSLLDYIGSLDCRRFTRLFTRREGASSHCQMGGLTYAQATIFGWLDHVFYGKPLETNGDSEMKKMFISLFERYGGKGTGEKAEKLTEKIAFVN